jgi:hypothetical protein
MKFEVNGIEYTYKEYLNFPRQKVTTTIRSEYYDSYKEMMDKINREYCKGWDIMLELLSEDKELLNKFVTRVKKY